MKMIVLTDLHAACNSISDKLHGELAELLLQRALILVNYHDQPDLLVLLGDLAHDGQTGPGHQSLERLAQILEKSKVPTVVIPGNHDGAEDGFYNIFDRPSEYLDIADFRIVPFVDPPAPEYNSYRPEQMLQRLEQLGQNAPGPLICLQHVPLFPPGLSDCPYHYTNAEDIIDTMQRSGAILSVSGHYHPGLDVIRQNGMAFVTGPALCEAPFRFLEIEVDRDSVHSRVCSLAVPKELDLIDTHVHTQFSYCGTTADIAENLRLGRLFNLAGLVFCEHTGQLYFTADEFWRAESHLKGITQADPTQSRMADYLQTLRDQGCTDGMIGLEVDIDFNGQLIVRQQDRDQVNFILGSVHFIGELKQPEPDPKRVWEEFLGLTEKLVQSDIDVLAHPFRRFHRAGYEITEEMIDAVVELLARNGVAAELNFHTQRPPKLFVQKCLERDIKLSLGSDTHALDQIGLLQPHLDMIRSCGYAGDFKDVLYSPPVSPRYS